MFISKYGYYVLAALNAIDAMKIVYVAEDADYFSRMVCVAIVVHTDLHHLEIVNTVEILSASVFAVIFIHQASAFALKNVPTVDL